MKIGDRVSLREDPATQGIVRKLAGHQVIVQWSEHTSTAVPQNLLKPYQPKGEGVKYEDHGHMYGSRMG